MSEGLIIMSKKELHRLSVMEKLKDRQLTQKEAGRALNVGVRQVKRLWKKYNQDGAEGLISKHRGKASNHQLPYGLKEQAISLVRRHYEDFGPTLAAEYLLSRHNIKISVETLRQAMIEAGLWKPKQKKSRRVYQQRERRACFGELVQLDGSPHDWFEGRGPKCCLLVLIDDATSALVGLHFTKAETTQGYFKLVGDYFKRYGLPLSFYSDKHSIFQVNNAKKRVPDLTQFGRAMETLGVEMISASTPQAKGRVERANKTLQDRLVKALRLEGIDSIEAANAYLPSFMEAFNKKFACLPRHEANAHIATNLSDEALDKILSVHSKRKLSKALELSYNNIIYQVDAPCRKNRLQHKTVLVCENYQGKITLFFNGEALSYKCIEKSKNLPFIADEKTLNVTVDELIKKPKKTYRPPENHPWRKFTINPSKQEKSLKAARR